MLRHYYLIQIADEYKIWSVIWDKMTSLMHTVVDNYTTVLKDTKDENVDNWFLMSSPLPVISILAFYLVFVLKLGPMWMETRKPFDLKQLMSVYNLYQVLFSLWLCTMPFRIESFTNVMYQSCQPRSDGVLPKAISNGAWWYFFSKVIELADTIFFVLRKKQNQVTFLHVYHHTITCLFSWGYLKFLPGVQGVIVGVLNSFVHVVMYSYYFIAGLGPQYQKYLWWKKYMTWIQLIQFCLLLTYLSTLLALDCKVPKALTFFFVANCTIFLYLFSDFYNKAYNKKKVA